jgi:hypothetical protein
LGPVNVGSDEFAALIEETDDAEQVGKVALTILGRVATPIVDVLLDFIGR